MRSRADDAWSREADAAGARRSITCCPSPSHVRGGSDRLFGCGWRWSGQEAAAHGSTLVKSTPSKGMEYLCSFFPFVGYLLSCLVTASLVWRIWGMGQVVSEDDLSAPLLSTGSVLQLSNYSHVRRIIYWFSALLLHSLNAILYMQKRLLLLEHNFDCHGLFSACSLPIIALITCIIYLVRLSWSCFPGKNFILAVCTICVFYLSIAFASLVYSNTTIAYEIIHIFITIVVNILRFSSQDIVPVRDWFSLSVAVMGTIVGFQWLLLDWCVNVGDTEVNPHVAYKIAASVGGAFRLFDVVVISCPIARCKANQLLDTLHEFFY